MLLSLENVTFGYLGDPILENVNVSLHEKERVGLIGSNGAGKTTLLRLLLGELAPDFGSVFRKNGLKCGYLEQSGSFETSLTVYDAMEEVFAEDKRLLLQLREKETKLTTATKTEFLALSSEIESLNKRISARDSYHFDVHIKTVLNGMGFSERYNQPVATMSGGEKTRLKLCKLLLEEPELLILDEPTNHLDMKTLFWLEEYLSGYKNALLIVSHDRYFLDKLTTRTLELEWKKLSSYKGNYTKYKELKKAEFLLKQREYEKQQEEIAHLQDYVDRNLVRATTAKSAQSRVNKLERMERLEKPVPPPAPPHFSFSFTERPYEKVLISPTFDLFAGETPLLKSVQFTLMRGEKCALLGDNGTGKTTLLKYLLKEKTVQYGKFAKIAYYDQENAEINPEERVLDAFWGKHRLLSQTDARKILAQCGLGAEDIDKKAKELSGGKRAKLAIALLEAEHANVLFLDEPTNHLDLPSREALEEALIAYEGTLLFVSHDRWFIEAVADRIVVLENNRLIDFKGSYNSYLTSLRAEQAQKEKPAKAPTATNGSYRSKEDRAREARRATRIKQIETELESLEAEEAALNEELIAKAADYVAVREISERLEIIHARSEALYEEYETLIG